MKTLKDLFELIAQATEENSQGYRTWFFNYSGHVNTMDVKFYFTGWSATEDRSKEQIYQSLDEDGIQVLYYFIKTRLGKNI